MSFTIFSYNATVLRIQPNPTNHMCWKMRPNPTHGWTQPMSISGVGLSLGYDDNVAYIGHSSISLSLSIFRRGRG